MPAGRQSYDFHTELPAAYKHDMRPVKLIAGLGNPGDAYSLTRHNVGFMAADRIARETGIALNTMKFHSLVGHGSWCGHDVIIAKPQTFMNRSGEAISALAESCCHCCRRYNRHAR